MEVGRLECLRRDFVSILIIALDVAPAVTVIQDSIFEFSRGMRRNGLVIVFVCLTKGLKIDFL